jgi:hypothetical protein
MGHKSVKHVFFFLKIGSLRSPDIGEILLKVALSTIKPNQTKIEKISHLASNNNHSLAETRLEKRVGKYNKYSNMTSRGGQLYWWRKQEYTEKTTYLSQVTEKL